MYSVGQLITIKGDPVEIVKDLGKGRFLLKFLNTGFEIDAHTANIRKGEVRDRLKQDIRGVCRFGVGKFTCKDESYSHWRNMVERCYNEKFHLRQPTYKDCEICEEWRDFQSFSVWFYDNIPNNYSEEKYEIDKDILMKGNKIYSPIGCCFVPKRINQYLTNSKASRGKFPLGVSRVKGKPHLFEVRCADLDGVRRFLGHVEDPIKGFYLYKSYKEVKIKELAEKYFNAKKITSEVYNALLNFKIEIGD